jgi:hypothetical protein
MSACSDYHAASLDLIERCAPSTGVVDVSAWEALGCPNLTSQAAASAIRPLSERHERRLTLEQRIASGNYAFASTPGGVESLEASHSVVDALYLWGDLAKLGPRARAEWVAYFNQYQDRDTGYFLGPYVREQGHPSWRDTKTITHPWDHMHDHLVTCLVPAIQALGGQTRFKLSDGNMTGRFLDRDYLRDFLIGRSWNGYQGDLNFREHNPWYLGNEYWYPGCILWQIWQFEAGTPAAAQARALLDEEWYAWHDANMSAWGLWYGDLAGDPQRLFRAPLGDADIPSEGMPRNPAESTWHANQVMGGAHQLWLYDFERHAIPDDKRAAQTNLLLAMQNHNDHHFGVGDPRAPSANSNDCTDVDCLTLLAYNFRRQNHRRADIAAACERAASAILKNKIDSHGVLSARAGGAAWTHHSGSHETYSPAGAPNLHQQGFYLWALLAAVSVLDHSSDPAVQSFIDHPWPSMPTHWLWVPGRHQYQTREAATFLGA